MNTWRPLPPKGSHACQHVLAHLGGLASDPREQALCTTPGYRSAKQSIGGRPTTRHGPEPELIARSSGILRMCSPVRKGPLAWLHRGMTMVAMVKHETKRTIDLPLMGKGGPLDLWHSILHRHESTAARSIRTLTKPPRQPPGTLPARLRHTAYTAVTPRRRRVLPLLSNEADQRGPILWGPCETR